MERIQRYESPLGKLYMTGGEALTGLWFEGQKHAPSPERFADGELPVFAQTKAWLDCYLSGRAPEFLPPLAPAGTVFRRTVWALLLEIPFGQTVTYGQLAARTAARLGLPRMSARAVGGAAGHNPIALLIPCHRVLGTDGSLTGYAAGPARKARLLELERQGSVPAEAGAPPPFPEPAFPSFHL